MSKYEFLTDEQWAILEPLIPVPKRRPDGRGRPWKPNREVLAGILWILRTGAAWQHLPSHFPPYQTCHRRFQKWVREGVMRSILETLARDLEERGQIDLSECFIDGTFVVAKKGVPEVGATKRGKGTKLMAISDASGLPLGLHTASASPHEVTLVEATLSETLTLRRPRRLIGDRAYDSDSLDKELACQGIELIAPNRRNHRRTQDGRPLRRYRRRWKIERLFAWLGAFRRITIRWEYYADNFRGFIHLACALILLRRYL
ncbi:IS5 family transposase [Desulfocurvibacter africanus]